MWKLEDRVKSWTAKSGTLQCLFSIVFTRSSATKMLAGFNEAGPVGRSNGITNCKGVAWLQQIEGPRPPNVEDRTLQKRILNSWAFRLQRIFFCRVKVAQQHHLWLKGSRPEASLQRNFNERSYEPLQVEA